LISLKIKLVQVLARKQNQEKEKCSFFSFSFFLFFLNIFWLEKTDAVISLTSHEQIEVFEVED
jgi:hypothetical protein